MVVPRLLPVANPIKREVTDPVALKLLEAFDQLRVLDKEMPAHCVAAFLYVASHDGCHKQAIEEDLDISTASCSRTTDILGSFGRPGRNRSGLGLITKEVDPSNRRRQILKLTAEGRRLIALMKQSSHG